MASPSPGSEIKSSSVSVTLTGSDETSGISYYEIRLDDGLWTNIGASTTHTFTGLSDGSHTIEVRAIDNAGLTNQDSVDFIVNTSPLFGPGYTEEAAILAVAIIVAIGIALYFLKLRKS
ncbi:MAG: OmpL47-type beta-barrel domain-containing protein [Candidatus Bathycorpusculaceae bacterium]